MGCVNCGLWFGDYERLQTIFLGSLLRSLRTFFALFAVTGFSELLTAKDAKNSRKERKDGLH
jgi:hypothetical protein